MLSLHPKVRGVKEEEKENKSAWQHNNPSVHPKVDGVEKDQEKEVRVSSSLHPQKLVVWRRRRRRKNFPSEDLCSSRWGLWVKIHIYADDKKFINDYPLGSNEQASDV